MRIFSDFKWISVILKKFWRNLSFKLIVLVSFCDLFYFSFVLFCTPLSCHALFSSVLLCLFSSVPCIPLSFISLIIWRQNSVSDIRWGLAEWWGYSTVQYSTVQYSTVRFSSFIHSSINHLQSRCLGHLFYYFLPFILFYCIV